MKKIISMFLAFIIVLGGVPIGDVVAWAADGDLIKIKHIFIEKTYNSTSDDGRFSITISGDNANKADVRILQTIIGQDGKPKDELVVPDKSSGSTNSLVLYTYEASGNRERLFIDGDIYSLGEDIMPRITKIWEKDENGIYKGKTDNIIGINEDIGLTGERIGNLKDTNIKPPIKAYFIEAGSEVNLTDDNIKDIIDEDGKTYTGIVKNVATVLGNHSLTFKQTIEETDEPKIEIIHSYHPIALVRGELTMTGDITIFPTQGPVGTTTTITAKEIESGVSIFLMNRSETEGKEEKYKYTKDNMVDNATIKRLEGGGETKLVFDIPNIPLGSYDIVVTNRITPNGDIEGQITKYKILANGSNKLGFRVVDGSSSVDLKKIRPPYSSIKGIKATLEGRNMGRLSNNIYVGGQLVGNPSEVNLANEPSELVLRYNNGKYNGDDIVSLTRKITVQIGTNVKFTGYNFKGDVYDYLDIVVPENDDLDKPIKDVIIFIEDEIEFIGGRKVTTTEMDSIKNGFSYKEIDYQPEINTIIPNIIQVDNDNEVVEDIVISITGKNFLKYGYIEGDDLKIKTPEISVSNQNDSSKWFDNKNIRIYEKSGVELENKEEEQLGAIIKVKIKKGSKIPNSIINNPSDLMVQNPLAVESDGDKGSTAVGEIKFVKVSPDKTPNITSIDPSIITTEGLNGVKIIGDKFDEKGKVKIYIDGEEVNVVDRKVTATGMELIFNAPPKPEGVYQIIVQNEEGGLAIYDDFIYTKTSTNIKLNDFNPKKGKVDTLVTITGQEFLAPNPLVSDISGIGIYRLIGTRVLLGNRDANDYNVKDGKISLEEFKSNDDIVKIEEGQIKLSNYYHSVILEDEDNRKYYTIYFNPRTGKTELGDGDKINYILEAKDNQVIATKGKVKVDDFKLNKDNIIVEGKTLKFKTPYKIENGNIIGNRVKVLDSGELIFRVPPMDREGYYDLTVINPDTKKDSKIGEKGFYYSYLADPSPKIDNIEPRAGSVDGGYYITISGSGFEDNGGSNKTSVIIGSIVVDPKDVEVSTDGKNLKVKIPKYPGNLAEETDMDRKTVAVVVVNPNGGSDSVEEGFSYIIPISHPKIDRLILNSGSAAGGETVIIEGSEFRFFEPYTDENNNSKWDEDEDEDGHEPFININKNTKWDDLRYWLSNKHKEEYDELAKDYEKLVRPILPKVYFGGKEVKIIDFTASTIEVETPKGVDGPVEVYVVNNDYGRSNTLIYTYTASNPRITNITPNKGRRQGKDKVEILGEGFGTSGVLVQFGSLTDRNISNSSIGISEPENSGRIRDRRSKVTLNDLVIEYDATKDKKTLKFTAEILDKGNKITYGPVIKDYNDGEFFFNVEELKNSEGESYPGYEEIRVVMERIEGAQNTSRLRVDRGFAPEVVSNSQRQVSLKTPSHYRTGKDVPVTLINLDGGYITTKFEYLNPDSNPVITDLQEDGIPGYKIDGRYILEIPYTGGKYVEVIGKDFRKPVSLKLVPRNHKEGMSTEILIPQKSIEYVPGDEDVVGKLIVKTPEITNERDIGEEFKIELTNEDGASTNSDHRYIKFTRPESMDLEVTKVTPNFGPTAGGTTVTIEGRGFRETMDSTDRKLKVYFGKGSNRVEVPESHILSVTHNKIVLKTPPYTAGLADITVENPDRHEKTLKDGFNYVSNPKITSVVNPENEKFVIEVISIEGGEKIKILGSDFMEGARVVFNPVLKLVEDDKQATGDIITIDDRKYILESGVEGTEVERINGQTITVTTPPGKLGDKGVIVINPDKGATNIYNVIYGIPEIGAPFNVRAELVFDQFIRVNWTGVKEATQYEIYMSEDGGKFEFIDTTELTSYAVQKLKPNRKYQFLVKAMGKYGTSKPIEESKSRVVKTGSTIGPIDDDGKPADKTETKVNGTTADIIIGAKDFTTKGMTIDLTRGNLAGVKDITIRIPASVVSSSLGKIQVIGKDYRMEFAPSIFKTSTIEDNKSKSNVGVVFKIATHKDNIDVKSGDTIVGGRYNLEAVVYVDKNLSKIDYINGKLNFTLDQDPLIIKNRRLTNIKTVRYDNSTKTWIEATTPNRLGLYTVIGSRR